MSINRFRFPIVLLITLVSLSSFSTEVSPRRLLRERIQTLILGKACSQALTAPILSQPQSVTRGVTRGLPRSAGPSYPEKVEQLSRKFSQVIAAEFRVAYGLENDPQSSYFLKNDPYEAQEKLKIFNELGVNPEINRAPSWLEFAKLYRQALVNRGLDPKKSLSPALVLYRSLGISVDPITKKESEKFDYLFVDPMTESFPTDMSSWQLLTKDVQFNIPLQPFLQAMRQGKFPLLDAVHDMSHFVAFLRFPDFMQTLALQIKTTSDPAVLTSGFKRREYWLTEALSVLDPKGEEKNKEFLRSKNRATEVRSVNEIEHELSRMKDSDLIQYAYDLAKHFESQLRDISGGNSNPAEKWFYLSESFGMRAQDLLTEDLSRVNGIPMLIDLSRTYFENGPVTLNANPKPMTNETATFSFSTFVTSQKLLAMVLKDSKVYRKQMGRFPKKTALEMLAKYVSRTEHLLTLRPWTYQEWSMALLAADLNPQSPIGQALSDTFGNEIISQYYLGVGAKRGQK